MLTSRASVLCVGEILWDVFPDRESLGGAPLNVACHLHALGRDVAIASRLGDDPLGRRTQDRLDEQGLASHLVQTDAALPTGLVRVTLIDAHTPAYDIARPAAWDGIEVTDALRAAAADAGVIVFGSLAQRHETSRTTVHDVLRSTQAIRVFDANLREPFVSRDVIEASLPLTNLLKINDEEMATFRGWFGLPTGDRDAAAAVCDRFGCRGVCVTRGAKGATLWLDGAWHEHPGYRVTAVDPVGAGDAFLAGLIDRLLAGDTAAEALAFAGAIGAFVASRPSACPPHDAAAIAAIRNGAGT